MATTTLQGLTYPASTDSPNGPAQILALANDVEKKVVMVFASAAARTTAFTAASVTATEGMLCWLQDVNGFEWYDGSTWRRLAPSLFARKTADESLASNVTLQNDDHLTLAYEANAFYILEGVLYVVGPAAADIRTAFTFTAAAGTELSWGSAGPDTGMSTLVSGSGDWQGRPNETASPSNLINYGLYDFSPVTIILRGSLTVGATPGTLTLQWAQNTSNAGAVIVKKTSWLRLTREA